MALEKHRDNISTWDAKITDLLNERPRRFTLTGPAGLELAGDHLWLSTLKNYTARVVVGTGAGA